MVRAPPLTQVLTSQVMSTTFGLELEVSHDRGRYTARGALPGPTRGEHTA